MEYDDALNVEEPRREARVETPSKNTVNEHTNVPGILRADRNV